MKTNLTFSHSFKHFNVILLSLLCPVGRYAADYKRVYISRSAAQKQDVQSRERESATERERESATGIEKESESDRAPSFLTNAMRFLELI